MRLDAIAKLLSIVTSIVITTVVAFGKPTMWPYLPLIVAGLILLFAVWGKLSAQQPIDLWYQVPVALLISSAVGCTVYQHWGGGIPFVTPGFVSKLFMFITMALLGYIIFAIRTALGKFEGKRRDVNFSIVVEEKTFAEQWQTFKEKLMGPRKAGVSKKADADLDGIFFDLGEEVKTRQDY